MAFACQLHTCGYLKAKDRALDAGKMLFTQNL